MKHVHSSQNALVENGLIFLIVILAFAYFDPLRDSNTDSRLSLVKAIVEEHRFEIDSYQTNDSPLHSIDRALYNGHYYCDKALGSSLIGAVVYFLARGLNATPADIPQFAYVLTLLSISLPCALLAPLLYAFTKQVSGNTVTALLVSLAVCLGTPYYRYSVAFYGHSLAGMCFFLVFYIWFQAKASGVMSPIRMLLSGLILGFMLITEYPTVLLALALGFYILSVLRKNNALRDWRPYLLIGIGFILPLSILFAYNHAIYGNPFTVGYAYEEGVLFRKSLEGGLFGFGMPNLLVLVVTTVHPAIGIVWQCPVLVLAFTGWHALSRQPTRRAELFLSVTAINVYFIVMSGYYLWWGGQSFTPRHLIPALPIFAIPLAFWPRPLLPFAWLVTLVATGQNLIAVASSQEHLMGFLYSLKNGAYSGGTTIYSVYLKNILSGNMVANKGLELLGLQGPISLVPLLVAEGLLVAVFLRVAKTGCASRAS